jgi:hypothetical protein
MVALYKNDIWGDASVEVASLARFVEADHGDVESDLLHLEGAGYVKLNGSRVALTENGYRAMEQREFSFCPHL